MAYRPLLLALGASLILVLSSPFVGQVRGAIQGALPGYYRAILIVAVVGGVAAAFGFALTRIRERRLLSYGLLLSAVVGGAAYAVATATGNPEVDAVERFHFVEYGMLTVLFHRAWRGRRDATSLFFPLLAGVVIGTVDEAFQWFVPERVGEFRDIVLNGVAVAFGIVFAAGVDPPRAVPGFVSHARPHLAWGVAAATMIVAAFFQAVHLGYEVGDDTTGVFHSRFTAEALDRAARDRSAMWSRRPPVTLRRMSREDQYLAEGLWHLQRRNVAFGDGDFETAWGENLILETWFRPVLDFPSFAAPSGARWSAEQTAAVAGAVAVGEQAPFMSTANPFPIHAWSRPWFLAAVLGVVALLALWGGAAMRRAAR
jgi:VanZ family protein